MDKMDKRIIEKCDSCQMNKENVVCKKIEKKFMRLCPVCLESMKYTLECLRLGTDRFIEKFGKHYERVSKYSVIQV